MVKMTFRFVAPDRLEKILAPPGSFEPPLSVSSSPGERDFHKGRCAMSLFAGLLQAVRLQRRRRAGPKTVRYSGIAMEQLGHRQLPGVNFTGNVPIDSPATQVPDVVVLPDNPLVERTAIASIVNVSAFDFSRIRLSSSPSDETLGIGVDQPHA